MLRECPILSASGDFLSLRIHGDHAAAGKWSYVWSPFFVQQKIPAHDAARPVAKYSRESLRPLDPVRLVVEAVYVGTSLCPVRILCREEFVNVGHRVGSSHIAMPGDTVDIFVYQRIVEFINRASREVIVVVQYPDLCVEATALQHGAEMLGDEFNFILLSPQRRGHSAVLIGVDFVLNGYRVNLHAFGCIATKEPSEIIRIVC